MVCSTVGKGITSWWPHDVFGRLTTSRTVTWVVLRNLCILGRELRQRFFSCATAERVDLSTCFFVVCLTAELLRAVFGCCLGVLFEISWSRVKRTASLFFRVLFDCVSSRQAVVTSVERDVSRYELRGVALVVLGAETWGGRS